MATPIRWNQRGPVARKRPQTPLRTLALNLTEAARSALAEPYMLTVERRPVYLRRLPTALDRFRIVHLSDFHLGPFTSSSQIRRAVETANRLEADIVALTGDYISHERRYAAPCGELLSRLEL